MFFGGFTVVVEGFRGVGEVVGWLVGRLLGWLVGWLDGWFNTNYRVGYLQEKNIINPGVAKFQIHYAMNLN